jgi:hypothetical protein
MEPLNFCRQIKKAYAKSSMRDFTKKALPKMPLDLLLKGLDLAVKFTLPDDGKIIEDPKLKGLNDITELHLPYESIVLEFGLITAKLKKIVVYAVEFKTNVTVSVWGGLDEVWIPFGIVSIPKTNFMRYDADGEVSFSFKRVDVTENEYKKDMDALSNMAAGTLLNFLNALACSNVHTEKLPPRKPSKTLGALPFDEYHVLTIDRPAGTGNGHAGGSHRSPREHLRRGHIRRLPTGSKIWVNAAVINAGAGGKIRKQYAMG